MPVLHDVAAPAVELRKTRVVHAPVEIPTRRVRRFVGVIERAIRATFRRVGVGLLIALQVIPSREDHTPKLSIDGVKSPDGV